MGVDSDHPEDGVLLNSGNSIKISGSKSNVFIQQFQRSIFFMIFNAISAASGGGGAKIATGSYVGTGTYGSSNPCSLTLVTAGRRLIFHIINRKTASA